MHLGIDSHSGLVYDGLANPELQVAAPPRTSVMAMPHISNRRTVGDCYLATSCIPSWRGFSWTTLDPTTRHFPCAPALNAVAPYDDTMRRAPNQPQHLTWLLANKVRRCGEDDVGQTVLRIAQYVLCRLFSLLALEHPRAPRMHSIPPWRHSLIAALAGIVVAEALLDRIPDRGELRNHQRFARWYPNFIHDQIATHEILDREVFS